MAMLVVVAVMTTDSDTGILSAVTDAFAGIAPTLAAI